MDLLWAFSILFFFISSIIRSIEGNPAEPGDEHVQRFSLHEKEDCSDAGEFYTTSVNNLTKVSALVAAGTMKCFCTWHGKWIFTSRTNYRHTLHPENSGSSSMFYYGKVCESRKINYNYLQLQSIRQLGNANDSNPGLSLYTSSSYFGNELYLTPTPTTMFVSLSLPVPKIFHSYGVTGRARWTVYATTNLTGNSTCLMPSPTNSKENEIKSEPKITILVGSIQSGCSASSLIMEKRRKFTDQHELIALYTISRNDTSETGDSQLVFDGAELKLPSPLKFQHYSIVGAQSWTIYSGIEFNGRCGCLAPIGQLTQEEPKRDFELYEALAGTTVDATTTINYPTMNVNLKKGIRLVGSIRKGCFECTKNYFTLEMIGERVNYDELALGENLEEKNEDNDYYDIEIPVGEIIQLASDEIERSGEGKDNMTKISNNTISTSTPTGNEDGTSSGWRNFRLSWSTNQLLLLSLLIFRFLDEVVVRIKT